MVISKMETTTKHGAIKGKIQQILEAMEVAGSKERAKCPYIRFHGLKPIFSKNKFLGYQCSKDTLS